MTVRFPIAENADAALKAPVGRAPRQKDAEAQLGAPVAFVRELSGPTWPTREAALAASEGHIDAEGLRPVQPEDRFCELVEVAAAPPRKAAPAEPVFAEGRRWPRPARPVKTVWRLSVGYWRPVNPAVVAAEIEQARRARKRSEAEGLTADSLRRMAQQPLKAVKPQQPLDIGLFETPLPESPGHFIPDE